MIIYNVGKKMFREGLCWDEERLEADIVVSWCGQPRPHLVTCVWGCMGYLVLFLLMPTPNSL